MGVIEMAKAYLVARTVNVTYAWIANVGLSRGLKKGEYWIAPVFNDKARIFTSKASAVAYRDKMNKTLHDSTPNADGSFTIDISGFGDFYIFPVEKGQ